MEFEILNRFTGNVQFVAEIDCDDSKPRSWRLRLAVLWAIKSGVNLSGADLSEANLSGADLRGADLSGADLSEANLSEADLRGVKEIPALAAAQTNITPEGQIVGWKKCQVGVIVKLSIPAEARRSNATGRKCRAEFADVTEVFGGELGISSHDEKTEYRVGQRVICDKWCDDRWQECAGGIHFFLTREEAEAY